jgi:hypothetical protein
MTIKQLEHTATHIVHCIRTNKRVYGGHYRIWIPESLPGHKLKVSVWYDHNTNGARLPTRSVRSPG